MGLGVAREAGSHPNTSDLGAVVRPARSIAMQQCNGSKIWRPSLPLEEGGFEASVYLEEEVLKALIVEDETSLAHKATMQY